MKTRLTALFLALLLYGCSSRTELPAEEDTVAEEIPIAESPQATQMQPIAQPPEVKDIMTIDGNTATITLGGTHSFDGLYLQGLGSEIDLNISINSEEIYAQESSSERWCWLGSQNTDSINITLTEGSSIDTQFKLSALAKDSQSRLSAYLPHSSYSEQILNSEALSLLDELTVNTGCYWLADGSLEIKQTLPSIIDSIQTAYPDLDIYCTINPKKGGAAAIMTAESRQILIRSMLDFCREYNIQGVDIDWEFPAEEQWDEFSLLITELSQALSDESRSLSLAFYPEGITLSSDAVEAIHKVNVMAYDQFDEQGRHSTYETAADAIDYFLSIGFDTEQLCLGIPAYGRPLSGEAVWPLYMDYAEQLADGSNLLDSNYFNSPPLAQDKTLLAREEGLQGVFLYHLGCDSQGDKSLVLACSEVLE